MKFSYQPFILDSILISRVNCGMNKFLYYVVQAYLRTEEIVLAFNDAFRFGAHAIIINPEGCVLQLKNIW